MTGDLATASSIRLGFFASQVGSRWDNVDFELCWVCHAVVVVGGPGGGGWGGGKNPLDLSRRGQQAAPHFGVAGGDAGRVEVAVVDLGEDLLSMASL